MEVTLLAFKGLEKSILAAQRTLNDRFKKVVFYQWRKRKGGKQVVVNGQASFVWEIPAGVHKAAPLCSLGQDPSSWALQGSRHRPWGSVRRGPVRFQKVPEGSGGPLTGRSLAPQYHFRQNNKQLVRLSEELTMTQEPVSSPACAPASLYSSVAAGVPRCNVQIGLIVMSYTRTSTKSGGILQAVWLQRVGAARVLGSPAPGLTPPHTLAVLSVANTLTQPIELSQNPLCPEIRHAGHRGFCNTLFGFLGKFVTNLQADLPSCSPDPTHPLANPSVLPFKPCWQGCWRARAVCLHENQTLLSYQNKPILADKQSRTSGHWLKGDKRGAVNGACLVQQCQTMRVNGVANRAPVSGAASSFPAPSPLGVWGFAPLLQTALLTGLPAKQNFLLVSRKQTLEVTVQSDLARPLSAANLSQQHNHRRSQRGGTSTSCGGKILPTLPGGEHQACSAETRPHEMKRRCRQPSTKRTQGPQKPAQRQSKAPVKQVVSLPSSAAVLAESREEMPCTSPAPVATGTRRCSARDAQAPGAREHSPDPGTTGKTHVSSTAETQERHVSLSFPFHDARTGNTTRSNPKKRKENVLFLANTERCHKTLPQMHWPAPSHAQHRFRAADLQTAHKFG
ncbi:hypothetical protein Anapl_01524 [Anas platyrhynchos]|uniref:Uncharacterized protein n=1 Tax=Anas platyrhynchos TaxID=8839 RepID=R0LN08_ANAPL|nr:hypothetical protein Anapl_01524 [Anas platyrhynchos]